MKSWWRWALLGGILAAAGWFFLRPRETGSSPQPQPAPEPQPEPEPQQEESMELPPESVELPPGSQEAIDPSESSPFSNAMTQALALLDEQEAPPWLGRLVGGLKSMGVVSERLPDRRRAIRVHTQLKVQVDWNGARSDAQVVNLGLGGLHLYMDAEPPRGDSIVLYDAEGTETNTPVRCKVQWTRRMPNSPRRLVGVSYNEMPEVLARSHLARLLAELGFVEQIVYKRRRRRRVEARLAAELDDLNQGVQATVVNLGVGGVMLECQRELTEGEKVCVAVGPMERRLAPLKVAAQVRYRLPQGDGWAYGLRFDHLNPDQVQLLGKYVLELLRD